MKMGYILEEIPESFHITWELPPGRWYWLSRLYVAPELRGQGHGTRLLEEAKNSIPDGAGIILKVEPFGDNDKDEQTLRLFYSERGFESWFCSKSDKYMVFVKVQPTLGAS